MATRNDDGLDAYKVEAMGNRHDEIREQLAVMEDWIEALPLNNVEDRRAVMQRIVDFLERYVLVEARREERDLFPAAGARAEVLRAEHGYIERWTRELGTIAIGAMDPSSALRFRATAFKLIGLLDAHMHCEEVVLARVPATQRSLATECSPSTIEVR